MQEATSGVGTFQGTNMVQLINAFAKLGVSPKPLLTALDAQPAAFGQMVNALHLTELVQLFWSTVVAGAYETQCYEAALSSIRSRICSPNDLRVLPRYLVFALLLAASENDDGNAQSVLKVSFW